MLQQERTACEESAQITPSCFGFHVSALYGNTLVLSGVESKYTETGYF